MEVELNIYAIRCLLAVWINGLLASARFINQDVTYRVTLNVYSGRPDPEWDIDTHSPLYSRVATEINSVGPTEMHEGLGYHGFTVEAVNPLGQKVWKTIGRHTNQQLEKLLFKSCKRGALSSNVQQQVKFGIYGEEKKTRRAKRLRNSLVSRNRKTSTRNYSTYRRKKRQSLDECSTVFEPENWNYGVAQTRNNCYNYATNLQTNTFAQPGRGSGRKFRGMYAQSVYRAAVRDGLTPLASPNSAHMCLIALFIWPGEDYHFVRLDNSGYWSQKSGRTLARDTDESSRLVRDPRYSDRGPYTVFAGWLGVGHGITIR